MNIENAGQSKEATEAHHRQPLKRRQTQSFSFGVGLYDMTGEHVHGGARIRTSAKDDIDIEIELGSRGVQSLIIISKIGIITFTDSIITMIESLGSPST